jgi:hypothetical protein
MKEVSPVNYSNTHSTWFKIFLDTVSPSPMCNRIDFTPSVVLILMTSSALAQQHTSCVHGARSPRTSASVTCVKSILSTSYSTPTQQHRIGPQRCGCTVLMTRCVPVSVYCDGSSGQQPPVFDNVERETNDVSNRDDDDDDTRRIVSYVQQVPQKPSQQP